MFYIPYDIKTGFVNHSTKVLVRNTDNLETLRELLQEKHNIPKASYTITKVNKNEFTRYFNCSSQVEQLQNEYDG